MDTTPSGLRRVKKTDTQGSRSGNLGLEVVTASRYLIKALEFVARAIGGTDRQTSVCRNLFYLDICRGLEEMAVNDKLNFVGHIRLHGK